MIKVMVLRGGGYPRLFGWALNEITNTLPKGSEKQRFENRRRPCKDGSTKLHC